MPQHDVHEAGALRANLPSTAPAVVLQPDAMVLDLEEFLVEREQVRGVELPLGTELLLGVGEDFFPVAERNQRRRHRTKSRESAAKAAGAQGAIISN